LKELFGSPRQERVDYRRNPCIGLAIAETFVKAGARVYICSRDAAVCADSRQDTPGIRFLRGPGVQPFVLEERQRLAAWIREHETSLNVLINNAGALWARRSRSTRNRLGQGVQPQCQGHVLSHQGIGSAPGGRCGQPKIPARIINIGSMNAFRLPKHDTYAYTASKAALHHLTRHLASKLAVQHITANVIAPGLFLSEMLEASVEQKGMMLHSSHRSRSSVLPSHRHVGRGHLPGL